MTEKKVILAVVCALAASGVVAYDVHWWSSRENPAVVSVPPAFPGSTAFEATPEAAEILAQLDGTGDGAPSVVSSVDDHEQAPAFEPPSAASAQASAASASAQSTASDSVGRSAVTDSPTPAPSDDWASMLQSMIRDQAQPQASPTPLGNAHALASRPRAAELVLGLELRGIIVGGRAKIALIGERTYREGDSVGDDGLVLREVHRDRVLLGLGDGIDDEVTLRLPGRSVRTGPAHSAREPLPAPPAANTTNTAPVIPPARG